MSEHYTEEQLEAFKSDWCLALDEIIDLHSGLEEAQIGEYGDWFNKEFELVNALGKSRKDYPEDGDWEDYLGFVLQWQRGDGYACYMIILDENDQYAYQPISEYSVESALLRGLELQDVQHQAKQARTLAGIFS